MLFLLLLAVAVPFAVGFIGQAMADGLTLRAFVFGKCRHADFYWHEKPQPIAGLKPVKCHGGNVWHLA